MNLQSFLVPAAALLTLAFSPAGAWAQTPGDAGFVNSLGTRFAYIEPGIFTMGSAEHPGSPEDPPHVVAVTHGFYLSVLEITQNEWSQLMEDNPSAFPDPARPVDGVSWERALDFIGRLNAKEGGDLYRLPTEAEWEYAARAASSGDRFFDDPALLGDYAWFQDNSGMTTHPGGLKKPNPFGLYDVYGNVFEWTRDFFARDYYQGSPKSDPTGPESQADGFRVVRGGCYKCAALLNSSVTRSFYAQDGAQDTLGFRLLREAR
ncbi:MAG: formylglycine-generating enzyme family protein [Deltaproteobacteria bacterium]|jgi:formylglycine-generating enzyme required for sulfatase activity|nr:formylglycine-generating enzyme family protein [Deltaproteobacteria bacterium]